MLIQCQSCTHKFRLNLERLPARKTFVRCKNCGTPIYIHGEEEEEELAPSVSPDAVTVPESLADRPVIPPWMAGMPPQDEDSVVVACPQCESRYRMPRAPLSRPDIRLKCTHCDFVFAPPAELMHPPGAAAYHAEDDLSRQAVIPPERIMPEPDDARMSRMLDDMAPDAGLPRPDVSAPLKDTTARPDADQDYLEATSLGEAFERPERGTVPEATKYGLFLKPGELPTGAPEPTPEAPPVEATPPEPELPITAAAEPAPAAEAAFEEDLPPLDIELPAAEPPKAAPAAAAPPPEKPPTPPEPEPRLDAEVPPPPALVTEAPHRPMDKKAVPDQVGWLSTRARFMTLGAIAAAVMVVAGMWTVWLWNTPGSSVPFTVETGRVHQLGLEDNLTGRYVQNKPSGQRLFVVQGVVENHFSSGTEISWVRLRGAAYTDRNQAEQLGTAFAFIGNVLTDAQLGSWDLGAIQAFYAYNNGRDNLNYRIPTGAKVPFQLVFTGINRTVGRTVAQVVSYNRNNLTVYVDPGR